MNLSVSETLAPKHRAVIARHLKALHISQRYHHFFRSEYLRLLRLALEVRKSQQDIPHRLRMFRLHAATKSINSWRHVFFDGVIANDELMDYLQLGALPEV